jgi:16S rRNA (guanine1207-N2)-methyltransferase
MLAPPTDVYYKQRLPYTVRGERFNFDVAHTLFSTAQIDDGTDLLLRTMELGQPDSILDIGCGAGILGIVLARLCSSAQVISVDRDLLAVRYTQHNARLNAVSNLAARGSVGLEQVTEQQFDLIVSNIPAKIGDAAIEREFILDPIARLRPGASYWFVVVSGLNRLIPALGTRNQLKLKAIKKRAGYTVYVVHKPTEST